MKKTLLATALLAGFVGAAQAETSVTLYGVAATGLTYTKVNGGNSKVGLTDGTDTGPFGSRWGLKGTEDLGGGLSTIFQVESGFNLNSGERNQGGRLFGRQAFVGLSGASWGTLTVGRQYNFYDSWMSVVSNPFDTSYGTAGSFGAADLGADYPRLDNAVLYQSPSFGGLQFGLGYSFNIDDTALSGASTSENARGITAGVTYTAGPLVLAATYDQVRLPSSLQGVGTLPTTARVYALGASYDFEIFKLHAGYSHATNGVPAALFFQDGAALNSYQLGVTVPVGGATSVLASWQLVDSKVADVETAQVYSLGVKYDLSKRTSVFAYGSYGKNFIVNSGYSYVVPGDVPNSKTATIGIAHQF